LDQATLDAFQSLPAYHYQHYCLQDITNEGKGSVHQDVFEDVLFGETHSSGDVDAIFLSHDIPSDVNFFAGWPLPSPRKHRENAVSYMKMRSSGYKRIMTKDTLTWKLLGKRTTLHYDISMGGSTVLDWGPAQDIKPWHEMIEATLSGNQTSGMFPFKFQYREADSDICVKPESASLIALKLDIPEFTTVYETTGTLVMFGKMVGTVGGYLSLIGVVFGCLFVRKNLEDPSVKYHEEMTLGPFTLGPLRKGALVMEAGAQEVTSESESSETTQ